MGSGSIGQLTDLDRTEIRPRRRSVDHLAAVISPSGAVAELDGASGARLVNATPELAQHAIAFLRTGLPEARFLWHLSRRSWLWTTLVRHHRNAAGTERAILRAWTGPAPYELTNRELEVLTLLAVGLTNVEIAGRLITSSRTISSHVAHILEKLDQPTRAGAAALAVEEGLMVLPFPGTPTDTHAASAVRVERIAAAYRGDGASPRRPVEARAPRAAPLLIGSVFPAHGPAKADGAEMRNGSRLAIQEANARGGVGGRPIEHVVVEADVADPDAAKAALKLLIDAEVDAITSGYFFGDSSILDGVADYGAPYLHGQTAESYVEFVRQDPGRHGSIFQVCPSETHYGVGFLRFLDELVDTHAWLPESRRIVLIETPVSGGAISTPSTLAYAERKRWDIAKVIEVSPSSVDWAQVVSDIHAVDPAAVMIASFVPEELAKFQRTFVSAPTQALLYAVYAPSIPSFLDHAGPAADGLLWSTVSGTYGDAIGRRFADSYERAFSRKPGRGHAGIAYDEVQLLLRAWAEVDNPRNFPLVSERLRHITHRGVNGSYCFDTDGQCGLSYPDAILDPSLGQAHLVLQVRRGKDRVLAPSPYVEDRFALPPWCS